MNVNIRLCRLEECAEVLQLWQEAEATPSTTDTVSELSRLVTENHNSLLVAEDNGRIVGSIVAGWDGWRGNMYRLAVLPTHRWRGIATRLVLEAERILVSKGARRLSILAEHQDAQAVAFWGSLIRSGYVRDPRMTRFVKTI